MDGIADSTPSESQNVYKTKNIDFEASAPQQSAMNGIQTHNLRDYNNNTIFLVKAKINSPHHQGKDQLFPTWLSVV